MRNSILGNDLNGEEAIANQIDLVETESGASVGE